MIYNLIKSSILNIWPSLVIVSVTMIVLRIAYSFNHRSTLYFYKEFWTFIGIVYLLLLYELVTRVDVNNLSGINLVPFKEIMRYDIGSKMFYVTVIGNIALFVPLGFIVSCYINPKKFTPILIIPLLVSFTIELVQLKIGRSFDIDDIILNTIGCIIGYLIYIGGRSIKNHLPDFMKSRGFNNFICVVIIIVIAIYLLDFWGVNIIK